MEAESLPTLLAKVVIAARFYLTKEEQDALEPALSDIIRAFDTDSSGGRFMPLNTYAFDGDRLTALSRWLERVMHA